MRLSPREQEKLMIFTADEVARRRRGRGPTLNRSEAVAIMEGVPEIRIGATAPGGAKLPTVHDPIT